MTKIFSKKNSGNDKTQKFMGAYVPVNLSEYISLYVIARESSKTDVLNFVLQEWKDNNEATDSEKELIYVLCKDIIIPNYKNSKDRLPVFIDRLTVELKSQNLSSKIISRIIKVFKDEKNK